jgi:hypothetical protein
VLTYRRECRSAPCFWKDDVDRKWEESPLDYQECKTYECPECGNEELEIRLMEDGKVFQIWHRKGIAMFDPRVWDMAVKL